MGKHKQYDPALKTKVVLELLNGHKTLAQLCREYEVSADLVCHWRDLFVERVPQVFADPRTSGKASQEQGRIAELERMVGRLTMELDASKKALQLLPPRRSNDGRS
jgi:transposase-like protein